MARIYTRNGDGGRTCLAFGQDVPKTHPRIEAYGCVDELNAALGLALVTLESGEGEAMARLHAFLLGCQSRLFELGTELACLPEDLREETPKIEQRSVDALEAEIDRLEADLPKLRSFVLPGGGAAGAALHFARTVCRRAERSVLALHQDSPVRQEGLCYLNRLSDYLFVASRAAAQASGVKETPWVPKKS